MTFRCWTNHVLISCCWYWMLTIRCLVSSVTWTYPFDVKPLSQAHHFNRHFPSEPFLPLDFPFVEKCIFWKLVNIFMSSTPVHLHCISKKVCPFMFDNNFGKCGLIFKILSSVDSYENSVCIHHKDFYLTCSMLLHYLVKFKNQSLLPNFHVEHDN